MAKVRSPNYPAIGLPKAIELAGKLYREAHTHKTDRPTAAKALGFGGLNGSSLTTISALKKYGLIDEDSGQVRLSKAGLTILIDPLDSKDRAKAILEAAFSPVLFAEFQKEYGDALPPNDQIVRAFLIKRGFAPGTVDAPIRAYRETLDIAAEARAIYNSSSGDEDKLKHEGKKDDIPLVGDLIQWEANGVLQMETPRRVRAIREHEGAQWVFVEGSETGIPMAEVIIEKRGGEAAPKPANTPPPKLLEDAPKQGMTQATFPLDEGEALIRIPDGLSLESYGELDEWIKLLLKRIKRSIQNQPELAPEQK